MSLPLNLNMAYSTLGYVALFIFAFAYVLVMSEEIIELRKSKPMVLSAGIIWLLAAFASKSVGLSAEVQQAVKHNILEFAELFLFLIVAMTYVNAIEERRVFDALKGWLIKKGFSYRQLFWITGTLAFFISPIADNMTTALIMCAIILAVGHHQERFIALSCINIVVAANAGGAFCPFGDITTLMVWQKGALEFKQFFQLFVPCVVNFIVPALLMHFAIPKELPDALQEKTKIAPGGLVIVGLFLLTIIVTVCFHHYLLLPPALGMMTGLAFLQFFSFCLQKRNHILLRNKTVDDLDHFDVFSKIQRIEWDTLLFFYGVMLCVGGLAAFGYLQIASTTLYEQWGATNANIVIGVLSAVVDNIPLMFGVLTMDPTMSEGQWLLVTLTTGVGGSLLSIGSAAGVALMGQSKGKYTFLSHLKWTWAIALGYAAAILTHFWINGHLF
ncbi:MAG: sodium:proton antiporter NhaD [Candidatus Berkiellales bacterium]